MEPAADRSASISSESPQLARLRLQVAQLKTDLTAAETARDLALDLVAEHAQKLAEVRALADLTDWAESVDPSPSRSEPSVRISDLRRVLR